MSPEDMTILLVDDEPDIVDATSVAFELVDFNVITANGGREAWDILNKKTVDLIITDVRMPDGTGLELLDNVKSKNLYFPEVILTTGYADFSVEEIFEKGADGLFWKPFDTKAIIKEVENRLLSESELLSVEPSSAPSRQISLQIDSINEVGS
ncbi:MAG: response regulator, partial [Bdellovibrionales bacterium]|nr:response regulator [Bdellovibrionales bacterium]